MNASIFKLFGLLLLISSPSFAQTHSESTEAHAFDYVTKIKPIFDSRCVQCHSCYNSPCQLKLTSPEGLERGLVEGFKVYDNRRIRKAQPSRLGIDRNTTEEWRNFSRKYPDPFKSEVR